MAKYITSMANQANKKLKKELPDVKDLKVMAQGYLKRVKKITRYAQEEVALHRLFSETYPKNKDINEILIKVIVLDSSYSTNLRRFSSINAMAEVIKGIKDFDKCLAKGELDLVDKICSNMLGLENEINPNMKYPKPFSFATKYCCNHNEKAYPIYDSFVAKVLTRYQRKEKFLEVGDELLNRWDEACKEKGVMSREEALKVSYAKLFVPVLTRFRDIYCEKLSYRQLDHFLWLLGKEYLGEGMPDEIIEESIVIDNYVVVVEEWGSISIYEICSDTTEGLDACADKIHYSRPENISDRAFGLSMIKAYSGSEMRENFPVDEYYIDCRENDVKVYHLINDRRAKATLSKINDIYPFGFDANKDTRQNGRELVKKVKSEENN